MRPISADVFTICLPNSVRPHVLTEGSVVNNCRLLINSNLILMSLAPNRFLGIHVFMSVCVSISLLDSLDEALGGWFPAKVMNDLLSVENLRGEREGERRGTVRRKES